MTTFATAGIVGTTGVTTTSNVSFPPTTNIENSQSENKKIIQSSPCTKKINSFMAILLFELGTDTNIYLYGFILGFFLLFSTASNNMMINLFCSMVLGVYTSIAMERMSRFVSYAYRGIFSLVILIPVIIKCIEWNFNTNRKHNHW